MSAWKVGDEFLPYHPDASHVNPDYRDGWNACYEAGYAVLTAPLEGAGDGSVPVSVSLGDQLHAAIMNLPYAAGVEDMPTQRRLDYKAGHRDARHAAAELALTSGSGVSGEACDAATSELARLKEALQDPAMVHVAMLRGEIAKPSIREMLHTHGEEALRRWDAAEPPAECTCPTRDMPFGRCCKAAPSPAPAPMCGDCNCLTQCGDVYAHAAEQAAKDLAKACRVPFSEDRSAEADSGQYVANLLAALDDHLSPRNRKHLAELLAGDRDASAPNPKASRWLPIETAPKDGHLLLLVPTRWGKWAQALALEGVWESGGFWVIFNADEAVQRVEPTHWQPLPGTTVEAHATQEATRQDEEGEFEVLTYKGDHTECVAGSSGLRDQALKRAMRYAEGYVSESDKVEVVEVTRKLVVSLELAAAGKGGAA